MSVLNKFDDKFINSLRGSCCYKTRTTYNNTMREVNFGYEAKRKILYGDQIGYADIYYQCSRFKYENPNTNFWLLLCVEYKNLRREPDRLVFTEIFFNHFKNDNFLDRFDTHFNKVAYEMQTVRSYEAYRDNNFFIYFQKQGENDLSIDHLGDLIENDEEVTSEDIKHIIAKNILRKKKFNHLKYESLEKIEFPEISTKKYFFTADVKEYHEIYYQYSKYKYENPNKNFWMLLCLHSFNPYDNIGEYELVRLFFDKEEELANHFDSQIELKFLHLRNDIDEIYNNIVNGSRELFFIFFEDEDAELPHFTKIRERLYQPLEPEEETDDVNLQQLELQYYESTSQTITFDNSNQRREFTPEDCGQFWLDSANNFLPGEYDITFCAYGIQQITRRSDSNLTIHPQTNTLNEEQELTEIWEMYEENYGNVQPQHISINETYKSDTCVLCSDENTKPNILFCGCGHLCACESCFASYNKKDCPVCRVKSDIIRKI